MATALPLTTAHVKVDGLEHSVVNVSYETVLEKITTVMYMTLYTNIHCNIGNGLPLPPIHALLDPVYTDTNTYMIIIQLVIYYI